MQSTSAQEKELRQEWYMEGEDNDVVCFWCEEDCLALMCMGDMSGNRFFTRD